jgi:sugar O-acyltransferase (sialic acid O-acetyltransferase NeuD family)
MSTIPRDLIVYGAGGIGRELASMAETGCTGGYEFEQPAWRIAAFVDDTPGYRDRVIHHDIRCLGSLAEAIPQLSGKEVWCHIAIGDNEDRMQAAKRIRQAGWKPASFVHGTALLSRDVTLGAGSFLGPYVTISPGVKIGEHVLINTRASIGHHVEIGAFSQISLNSSILGHGRVERGAMIGAHAVVMSNVTVGAWATVAVGTPVLRSVKPGHTVCLPLAHTIFERKVLPED